MTRRDRPRRSHDVATVVYVAVAVPLVLLVLVAATLVGYVAALTICDLFYRWRG